MNKIIALFLFAVMVLVSGCGTASKNIHPDWSGWKKVAEVWFDGGKDLPLVSNIFMTGDGLIIITDSVRPENYSWKGEVLHLFLNDKGELESSQQWFTIRSKWAACCKDQKIVFEDKKIVFKIIPKSKEYILVYATQTSETETIPEFEEVFTKRR